MVIYGALWYPDKKEFTGERQWHTFRTLRLWRWLSPALFHIHNKTAIHSAKKRLFLLMPCKTPMPLWWFGCHGGYLPSKWRISYMVPPLLMQIPILRDLLLWSGAVTYRHKQKLYDGILDLVNMGRSVCFSPDRFGSPFMDDTDTENLAHVPDLSFFTFCRTNHIEIIPIVVDGEQERYRIATYGAESSIAIIKSISRFFQRIQEYTRDTFAGGYPITLFFWTRYFSREPPPPLEYHIGTIIHCDTYETDVLLRSAFAELMGSMLGKVQV